jgi:hypothetical protein
MSQSPPRPTPPDESYGPFPADLSPRAPNRTLGSLLYNHNPFYVISAVLMLYAVRSLYGELEIGSINCWIMMGVLAGYTALLAGIGVLIVRWGRVWEDARSIFVVVLLLFLAVSVSADDLFVKMESPGGAALLLLLGYLFSAGVTELVLRGSRLRMGRLYRIPLHLFLALFYLAPWLCASLLEDNRLTELQWRIFAFPVAAAVLLLTLVPATRRGPAYADDNGGPWRWPLYPWTAFGAITLAVALRTFALCMTFGPTGPIWVRLPASSASSAPRLAISFDTMWGPYFLVPLVLAVLVLYFEAGLTTGNRRLVRRVLMLSPLSLLLALPWSSGPVHWQFLREVTATLGSPMWLSVCLLGALYGWIWSRGVIGARFGVLGCVASLTFVTPQTIRPQDFGDPQLWPVLLAGAVLLLEGLRVRSSRACFAACGLLAWAAWHLLPDTPLADWRAMVTFHVLWLAAVLLGLTFRDEFASLLRGVGALLMPLAALLTAIGPWSTDIPLLWQAVYIVGLSLFALVIAQWFRSRWYLYAFTALLAMIAYGIALTGYRQATSWLGRAATIGLGWSMAALLTAFLISAHKAGWLPPRLFPRWTNGRT